MTPGDQRVILNMVLLCVSNEFDVTLRELREARVKVAARGGEEMLVVTLGDVIDQLAAGRERMAEEIGK